MTADVPSSGFLSGVSVLQLGDGVAGSSAAALLASLGAEVTRLPVSAAYRAGPKIHTAAGPVAAVDLALDWQKQTLPSDTLPDPGNFDIVINDGAREQLAAIKGVVVVNLTPFGMDGRHWSRPGGEIAAQASGGLLATIEDADGEPVPAPGYVASKAVGAVAALAALHGLDRYNHLGGSVVVDVSAQEAVIFVAALPECAHTMYRCPGRAGSGRYLAPSGVFECQDGLVRITAVENHQWQQLRKTLGDPAWAAGLDERAARITHADLINAQVTEWTKSQDKADCAALLQANGVPSTPVNSPADLLDCPQLLHRSALESVRIDGRDVTVLGPPWTATPDRPVPKRGTGIAGLRIAELTHVLAGPIVGALLGGMGATVVRLEDPDRLDIYRRSGPFADGIAGPERGAYYAVANHSKKSVLLDPQHTSADVAAILADSDVLIENVGSSRLKRLGVDPSELADTGRLTLRVSGFGSDGPLAGYRVYANNVQGYGGLAALSTTADGSSARLGTVLADPLSSVIGALVIAAWALNPNPSGGTVIDLSMAEVVASTIAEYVAAASIKPTPPSDDVRRFVRPSTDDRWVAVELVGTQCEEGSIEFVCALITTNRADDAAIKLQGAGIAAAVVRRAEELVDDSHLNEREFFPKITHPDPELGTARLVGLPWRFAGEGPIPLSPPPALGSSNAFYTRSADADVTA